MTREENAKVWGSLEMAERAYNSMVAATESKFSLTRECPYCFCKISLSEFEDYRACERCHELYRD